jgi:hypothetical protein
LDVAAPFQPVRDDAAVLAVPDPQGKLGVRMGRNPRDGDGVGPGEIVENVGEFGVFRCAVRVDDRPEGSRSGGGPLLARAYSRGDGILGNLREEDARSADPLRGLSIEVLQIMRRLLIRSDRFRLEREFAGPDFRRGERCALALLSRFGLKSRRWPLGRHGRTAIGGFATKQRDLGLCQAATAAIILSMLRMLSARRKL